jgi:homotetrameric cytidine deaminase
MKKNSKTKYARLIRAAKKAIEYSQSPYSHFRVGAAIQTSTGKIFTGCNIENSSYSLTICAERTAIFKAISEGHRKFTALAICGDYPDFIPPCGACRQVISDLAGDIQIILVKPGSIMVKTTHSLLPLPFRQSFLD